MNKKQMKLGLSMRYLGYHGAAWRHPEVSARRCDGFQAFPRYRPTAERRSSTWCSWPTASASAPDDEPRRALPPHHNVELEPLTLLSALAAMTSASASSPRRPPPTTSPTTSPANAPRSTRSAAAAPAGTSSPPGPSRRRGTSTATSTWTTRRATTARRSSSRWSEGPLGQLGSRRLRRRQGSGIFFDARKLHVLNHKGKHFKVRGPLSVRRTPQGRPILVQAGVSEVGQRIAARHVRTWSSPPRTTWRHAQDSYASVEVKSELRNSAARPEPPSA